MAIQNPALLHQELCTLSLAVEPEAIRTCLLEPVAGRQRLIAWITVKRDIHAALNGQIATACTRLGERIERQLWNVERYRPALNLVADSHLPTLDAVTAAVDPRPPMRVWIASVSETVSLSAAKDAVSSIPSSIVGETILDNLLTAEKLAQDLVRSQAEVLVVTGGYDEGKSVAQHGIINLCTILYAALNVMEPAQRPLLIYAGSKPAADLVSELFGDEENGHRVQVVDNVRPAPKVTTLAALVGALQDERWRLARNVSGIAALAHWVSPPAQLTALDWSFSRLVQVWAERHDQNEMHGVYNAPAWRQHVWVRRGHARVRSVFIDPASPHPMPDGWPPIQLWSGSQLPSEPTPPRLRWLDRSGMAPLIATTGQISPSAMFQVLARDIFGNR